MGVKISPLTDDVNVKKIITYENLVGKKIAIDAFNTLYQFLAIIRGRDGTPLKDLKGNVTSHLSGLFYRTINILEKDIRPIYVFDGPPNPMKMKEIERRREVRREATVKMKEARDLGRTQEAAKYAQATSKLNSTMIEESKEFIRALGIPVVESAQDGEAQAAYLVNQKLAWAVGSQDYDSLLFGAPRIVRNLSQNRTRKVRSTTVTIHLEWLTLSKVLEKANLTREQLVDIGILVGVDFFPGIAGIGPKTAIKLIREHGSIDRLIANRTEFRKQPFSDLIGQDTLQEVRNIFLNPAVKTDIPALKWRRPDNDKIREILCGRHNFDDTRVEAALQRLQKSASSTTQTTMESFFKK